jgi:L-phenylalanine/L-methionine N-acetyltransferase
MSERAGARPLVPTEPAGSPVPAGVLIRPARPSDARAFAAFWREILEDDRALRAEDGDAGPATFRRRFRAAWSEDGAQLMAVEGGRLVGYVGIERERQRSTRHVASLAIGVAEDRRGAGIGTALLAAALGWARSAGVRKVLLSVYPHNDRALALYRRFGFVEEGRLARQSLTSAGYEDELLLALWLGPNDEERGAR